MGLAADVEPAKILSSASSDASATLPTPTPQRLKKWRRVSNRRRRSSGSMLAHSLVRKSSRFNSTRETLVQAASSGRSDGSILANFAGGGFSGLPSGLNLPPL